MDASKQELITKIMGAVGAGLSAGAGAIAAGPAGAVVAGLVAAVMYFAGVYRPTPGAK